MSNLIIMRGLPGSGKSTKAKKILEQGNAVRLNKDLLRLMLHNDIWSSENEELTQKMEHHLASTLLGSGKDVIIDDTNLNTKIMNSWLGLTGDEGFKTQIIDLTDVPLEICIERDFNRFKTVGKEVIINMARQYGLYKSSKQDVIVDIDGTLADCRHRQHFVQGETKDWQSFFYAMREDTPYKDIVNQVRELSKTYNIVLVSGRPDNYKEHTLQWLSANDIPYETLIMRKAGDHRPDDQVKRDILKKYFTTSNVHLVIDDRPSVIRMWKEQGLNVQDVGNGIEF